MIHQECYQAVNSALNRHFHLHNNRLKGSSPSGETKKDNTPENDQSIGAQEGKVAGANGEERQAKIDEDDLHALVASGLPQSKL